MPQGEEYDELEDAPRPRKSKPKAGAGTKKSGKSSSKSEAPPVAGGQQELGVLGYTMVGLFMAGIIGIAIFMANRQSKNEAGEQAAFAAVMDQFLKPPQTGTPPAAKAGKFAVIDIDERKLHHTQTNLGDRLRAWTPETADYIVQLKVEQEVVGEYVGLSSAKRKAIKVTHHVVVIDKASWMELGRKTFVGSDPPIVKVGEGDSDVYGSPPDVEEVKAYYRSLTSQ